MQRYGELVVQALRLVEVPARLVRPEPMFSRWCPARSRAFRWASFLDKFLLFPLRLLWIVHWPGRLRPRLVHVLDQGNGVYLPLIQHRRHLLTLHDLIALRAGTGQHSTHPCPRFSLYQWINAWCLRRCSCLLCVSAATRADVISLWHLPSQRLPLLPNPLDPFFLVPDPQRHQALPERYWLHVGNSAWYKNRLIVLRIHAELLDRGFRIPLLLIGEPLNHQEAALIARLGSGEWVTALSAVDSLVRSAYAHAEGLIFPSLEEGFGWPVLEAMAQGCPVYCSNRPPLTELAGDGGVPIDPLDPVAAAATIEADGRDPRRAPSVLTSARQRAAGFSLKAYGTRTEDALLRHHGAAAVRVLHVIPSISPLRGGPVRGGAGDGGGPAPPWGGCGDPHQQRQRPRPRPLPAPRAVGVSSRACRCWRFPRWSPPLRPLREFAITPGSTAGWRATSASSICCMCMPSSPGPPPPPWPRPAVPACPICCAPSAS